MGEACINYEKTTSWLHLIFRATAINLGYVNLKACLEFTPCNNLVEVNENLFCVPLNVIGC